MKAAISGRKVFLAGLTAASVVGMGTLVLVNPDVLAGPPAPQPKQDYSISASSETVAAGQTAVAFTVAMVPGAGNYDGSVQLDVKGLPKGVTVDSWSDETSPGVPTPVTKDDPTRTLNLDLPATMKVGTYTFHVTGVNAATGKDARDTTATLGVTAPTADNPVPTFSITLDPTARTVVIGDTASYTVNLLPGTAPLPNGVALSLRGLPGGVTGQFTPRTSLSGPAGSATASTSLQVTASSKSKPGNFHFTVTGTNGKAHYDVFASLTIQKAAAQGSFSLALSPDQQQVAAGGSAVYALGIARTSYTDPVTLRVSGLPTDAIPTWSFAPQTSTTDSSATLTVKTNEITTPDGNFEFTVTGTSGSTVMSTKARIVVNTPPGKAFGISGLADGSLTPGGTPAGINLQLANPNDKTILITNLDVVVTGTSAGSSCDPGNFEVVPYSGGYPLRLNAKTTQTLSGLGVAAAAYPQLQMKDLPSNQDACKGAQVYLSYSGNAREAG